VRIRGFLQYLILPLMAVSGLSSPALAQFSQSYKFLESVRKQEAQEVTDALSVPGTTIINTQDITNGQTALAIVIGRRDVQWVGFLLAKGADPNIADNHGVTPLMLAANLGFEEGVSLLVERGARLNDANNTGETPLMTAVHRRDLPMMRVLLKAGANPERTDSSGRSARDYATLAGSDSPMIGVIKEAVRGKGADSSQGAYGPKL
jgi:hypothetical protein